MLAVDASFAEMPWWLVLLGLEFPPLVSLLDCSNRPPDHFAEGADDRKAWLRWLWVAVATAPILIGYGIVMGYYYTVVRRNSPGSST